MTGSRVNGSGKTTRSGAQTLALLATPLNCRILKALAEGPRQQVDLRRDCGLPAQTTLRVQLKKVDDVGALEKRRRNRFPGVLEYELTEAGRDLLEVATVLERWLERSPQGSLSLDSSAAKAAIKAMTEGWSTCMLRVLAAKPLTLTELDAVIPGINYPSLERRLAAMKLTGQVEARPGDGRGTPYGLTKWVRQAIAPLMVAARWERRHIPETAPPIGKIDAEAAMLLAMPLLRLPVEASGSCRMAADIPNGKRRGLAGVLVEAREGRIASCTTRLEGYPDAWVSGSITGWFAAVIESDTDHLELGGDCALAQALMEAVRRALFGSRQGQSTKVESA